MFAAFLAYIRMPGICHHGKTAKQEWNAEEHPQAQIAHLSNYADRAWKPEYVGELSADKKEINGRE